MPVDLVAPELVELLHPLDQLRTYHKNPRVGAVAVICESLAANGQYRPIVANRGTHTGRANEVLAGNHTMIAARELGWKQIAVTWVDVTEAACKRIVTVDNRANDLASYDQATQLELLQELAALDGGLEGTGYTPDDLDDLALAAGGADLDDLAAQVGDPVDSDTWPTISIRVPHATRGHFQELMDARTGQEHERFAAILADADDAAAEAT